MPSEDTKILEFNQYQKSDKAPYITYAELACLIEKIDGCKNNPENKSKTQVNELIPSGFSISAMSSFKSIENKHDIYRGKDCMKKLCETLRQHKMKIILKKKKMKLLTKEQHQSYKTANSDKVRGHCHYTGEYRDAAHKYVFKI